LLVIVQGTPEWFNTPLAKKLCKLMPADDIYPMLPAGNPEVHRNTLTAIAANLPDNDALIQIDTDEYMTDKSWELLTKTVIDRPGVSVFWIMRKDFYDGHQFDSMPGEIHPRVTRGIPIHYSVKLHIYPTPACSIDAIRYLPDSVFIEHRRSIARTISSNSKRSNFTDARADQVQRQFLYDLKTAWLAKGLEWPEVGK